MSFSGLSGAPRFVRLISENRRPSPGQRPDALRIVAKGGKEDGVAELRASMSILPSQCRAARALLDMDHAELARRAVVPRDAIADFEIGSRTPLPDSLAAIRAALEAAGVIFIDENGEGRALGDFPRCWPRRWQIDIVSAQT